MKTVPQIVSIRGDIEQMRVCEACAEKKHGRCVNYVCFPRCECQDFAHFISPKKFKNK